MSRSRCRTTAPADPQLASARRATAPEARTGQTVSDNPVLRAALSEWAVLGAPALGAALQQASGGRLARASHALLQLQGQYGNRYVERVVTHARQAPSGAAALVVQAKLALGPAGDQYEQEADRVAEWVVGHAATNGLAARPQPGEGTQARPPHGPGIQHLHAVVGSPVDAPVAQALQRARGGGQPLPAPLRRSMERAFGADFTAVRAHTDAEADMLNRSLGARAFTAEQDIFFRRGSYDLAGRPGQRLLAHELSHVVQQNTGLSSSLPPPHARPAVIQRYLFHSYTNPKTVEAFKEKYGPAHGPMALIFHSLDNYVAHHPRQPDGAPVSLPAMNLDQLRVARGLLLTLQDTIDSTLSEWGPTMKAAETQGAELLRVLAQHELMQVVGRQGHRGEFEPRIGPELPRQRRRSNVARFTEWLTAHPVYRKWEHQGAGACANAAREILDMLRAELFTGNQRANRVKARGIKAIPPKPFTGQANHFVVVAEIGTRQVVIDATMGQFLGGRPIVEPEARWKKRFGRSKVSFANEYLKPASVEWQDFQTMDEAVAYAPQRFE
jgi:hypothetical protein